MNDSHSLGARLLLDAARTLGADVQEAEAELVGNFLRVEFWGDFPEHAEQRPRQDLPRVISAARLDGTPVLFGELGEESDFAILIDKLRRYRNQATIARSWLGADAQDLQLFLIGPAHGATSPSWRDIARQIESDDRVCRKLVWLPGATLTVEAAAEFLSRTFLATPWKRLSGESAQRLDHLSSIPVPAAWLLVLSDDSLSGDQLVERLVEVTE